jgi:prepilin-type N-terminal cleavage/methylation domain-containing protein
VNTLSRRDDEGFTLIELLVAVVIVGIIFAPLSSVVIAYLRNTDTTTARLTESHDLQIASAYWAQDVASVGTHSTASPYALVQSIESNVAYNVGNACGVAGTPNATVRFSWDAYAVGSTTATLVRVAYVVETVSGQTQLHRIRCSGSSTPVSDLVLAHDLDPDLTTPLTVGCPTDATTCANAPAVPMIVNLDLTIKDPKSATSYSVTLTGQRRQS